MRHDSILDAEISFAVSETVEDVSTYKYTI